MSVKKAFRCRHIYTATTADLIDGYVVIEDNKIIGVGAEPEIRDLLQGDTEILDYTEGFIMPGFHDFHLHLLIGAMMEHDGVLRYAESEEEAARMLWEKNRDRQDKNWILGGAWDHFRWPDCKLPAKQTLDRYFPDQPLFLLNKECHGAWLNSKALELFNITRETIDPPNGSFERDENGEPTGYVHEAALIPMANAIIYDLSAETLSEFTKSFMKKANSLGITSVGDLPIYGIVTEQAYKMLEQNDELTLRIHFAVGMFESLEKIKKTKEEYGGNLLRFIGVKDFLDGTPMGHSGYMLEPYTDMPDYRGEPVIEPQLVMDRVSELDREGIRVRLHACGDAAVRLGLDAFEQAAQKNGTKDIRHSIEHIESTTPKDIARFGKLGVTASVQPEHMPKYGFYKHPFFTMIGEERMNYSWPFQSILAGGGVLAYGTDYPVVELSPFRGIYRSVHRLTNDGEPAGGFNPKEKVSLHESLRAYTIGSAYAAGREKELGTLEAGKLADLAVLDRNLFECIGERDRMFETQVLATVMDGKTVYQKITE